MCTALDMLNCLLKDSCVSRSRACLMGLREKGPVNGHCCVGHEETLIEPLKPAPLSPANGEGISGEGSVWCRD